ncbi:MAG TPA: type IX secretion system membrane protein PorP/SprF [Chryseosolibacter sp.]|nr:type IX secretion system membrane protein PorP/SprF [Chryseosolibacter sp.]
MTKGVLHIVLVSAAIMLGMKNVSGQQRVQFTQYMFNGLVINPAYAGADEALSLTFVHRRQWAGLDHAPATQTLSAHSLFRNKQSGVGLTVVNDKIGVHKDLSLMGNYAYHIPVSTVSTISFGISAGFRNRRSDYSSLLSSVDQHDPKISALPIALTSFNAGTGVYFRNPKMQIGFSAPSLIPDKMQINDSVSVRLSKSTYLLFGKYIIRATEEVTLEPGMLFKMLQDAPLSYDINMNVIYRRILTMGLSYRTEESIDMILKAQLTEQLQLGYSYDHPIGVLNKFDVSSHEFVIQYLFKFSDKNTVSPR